MTSSKEVNNPVGYRLELNPTEEQIKIFRKYFGVTRFVYNYGVNLYNENRTDSGKLRQLSFHTLTSKLTEYKKEKPWLSEYDIYSLRIALRNVHTAVSKFFDPELQYGEPRYKSKKQYSNHESFGVRGDRITIWDKSIRLPSIGIVKMNNCPKEVQGHGNKRSFTLPGRCIDYISPRVIYDGIKYYITFSLEEDPDNDVMVSSNKKYRNDDIWKCKEYTDIIGIDFGCKSNNWLVSSNNTRLEMPDISKEEYKKKKLQRKFSRQLRINDKRWEKTNPSDSNKKRPKTKNELKVLRKWNKVEKRIHNIKMNALNTYISQNILQNKPQAVVIEDIYALEMLITDKHVPTFLRNGHNYTVMGAMPYTVKNTIIQTVSRNDIPVIIADKEYPSSQLCSNCGNRMDIGKKRIYRCHICGMVKDRDVNASCNLRNYGHYKLEENNKLKSA